MPIDFYTNPMSRGQIVRWMLEEVGAPYHTHVMDYDRLKEPDYLAVNPMAKVPAIVHDGVVVTEGAAICAYLADAFPDAGLAPPPGARGDYYRWLFFAAGPVEQAMTNHALGFDPPADRQRLIGYGSYQRLVAALDDAVAGRAYLAGDAFSAADLLLGAMVDHGTAVGTLPKSPALEAYVAPMRQRPAYIRAKAIDNALIAEAKARADA